MTPLRSRPLMLALLLTALPLLMGTAGVRAACAFLCTEAAAAEAVAATADAHDCCDTTDEAPPASAEMPCGGACDTVAEDVPNVRADDAARLVPPLFAIAVVVATLPAAPAAVADLVPLSRRGPPSPTLVSLSCRLDC